MFWLSLIPDAFKTINGITSAIANERLKLIEAKTEKERIDSTERIKHLEAIRDVRLNSGDHWETRLIMAGFGIGPLFLLTKIFVWDKALGQWTNGSTDKLDDNLWWVITAQVGFYFLAKIFKK